MSKIRTFFNSLSSGFLKKPKPGMFSNSLEIINAVPEDRMIKVVPVGKFPEHHNGGHEVTREHVKEMAVNCKKQGTDILFDYGHESLWNSSAKAAGWSPKAKVEAREDGLYIEYPVLTNAASVSIDNDEYRYLSPVYTLNSMNKQGKPIGATLVSVGITNTPYFGKEIDHIKNSQTTEDSAMNEKLAKLLGLKPDATEAEIEAKVNSVMSKATELGLNEDSTFEEILVAVNSKTAPAPKADPAPKVEAQQSDTDKRLEKLENERVENLVNSAITQGKILPADKDLWLNAAKSDYDKTKSNLDAKKVNSVMPGKVTIPKKPAEGEKVNAVDAAAEYIRSLRS